MVWNTNAATLEEAKRENRYHLDNGTVCDVTIHSAIVIVNLSNNDYFLDLTKAPERWNQKTNYEGWDQGKAPSGQEVKQVRVRPWSFYVLGGRARSEWLHRPLWIREKTSIRLGFNFRKWQDPVLMCQRLVAALVERFKQVEKPV